MALSWSTGCVHRWLNSAANGGVGFAEIFRDGIIDLYSGARPASADSAVPVGTVRLARVTVNGGAFVAGAATNGLEFGPASARAIDKAVAEVWQYTGLANGVTTWFRFKGNGADDDLASTTLPRVDGTVGPFSADMIMIDNNIIIGQMYTLNRFRLRWPTS